MPFRFAEVIYEYDPFGRLWAEYDSEAALGEQDERWDGSARKWYKLWDNPWMAGGSLHLDPANDDPFVILDRTWPYTYNKDAVGYEYKTLTYYDGFGRPIQQQDMMAEVDGQTGRRDIIVSTEYGAQGKATCVSVPRDIATYKERINWPSVTTFLDDDCESLDATLTTYDNIGRTTTITNPGGFVSSI